MTIFEQALEYASQGLAVFPVKPRGKAPLTPNGHNAATTDPETIRAWWMQWPQANIGIATGAVSGVFVLDVDVDFDKCKDGMASLAALEAKIGPIPRKDVVRTGSGGLHIYLAMPEDDEPLKCSVGQLGVGLDVRGDGGYVVAPPSIHANGNHYAWEVTEDESA